MADGGGDMLTPDMALAAAGPPQEALGACDGHTNGSFEDFMGLVEDWGEALAVEQEPRRDMIQRIELSRRFQKLRTSPSTSGIHRGGRSVYL